MRKGKSDSGGNDVLLISAPVLATLGTGCLLPMTSGISSISTVGIARERDECGRGGRGSFVSRSEPFLRLYVTGHHATLTRQAAAAKRFGRNTDYH